jgi:hypothetical protein
LLADENPAQSVQVISARLLSASISSKLDDESSLKLGQENETGYSDPDPEDVSRFEFHRHNPASERISWDKISGRSRHIALWAKSREVIDDFYKNFLLTLFPPVICGVKLHKQA